MTRRANSLSSTPTAISREIDSQYDNVKIVADNIDDVNTIAPYAATISEVSDSITATADILVNAADDLALIESTVTTAKDATLAARDTVLVSEANTLTAQTSATTSALNAATSETNASVSEVNAATSAATATAAATASALSEANALASETAASISAANASAAEANIATFESKAEEWATNPEDTLISGTLDKYSALHYAAKAKTEADSIAALGNTASASEAAAQASADAAAISEANALASETAALAASTEAVNAKNAAIAAETNVTTLEGQVQSNTTLVQSLADQVTLDVADLNTAVTSAETDAQTATTQAGIATSQAGIATTKASEASTSAASASTSEANANTSAINASTSETNAENSAIAASNSETASAVSEANAATSATNAATSETNAASSAVAAENSKSAAETAQLAAEQALDEFTDVYLGAFASDPTTDNDGDPLTEGVIYYKTGTSSGLRIYTGSSWDPAVFNAEGAVLSFNGRTGAVSLNNLDITSATGQALDEAGTPKFASIQLTGGANPEDGKLSWNAEDETVDLITGVNTVYQLGQELGIVVRNLSGASISNGTVVRVLGASGDKVTVAVADNSDPLTSDSSFAVVTETIPNNSTGKVTTEGLVRGLDTSSFTEGSSLWLGASGVLTDAQPVSPSTLVHIGWVVRSHVSSGAIYVKVNKQGYLGDSNDVLINDPVIGDFLGWDNNTSLWKNITIDKSLIDALDVNAATLDGFDSTYFEPADATILRDADIGSTVQQYNANTVVDANYVHTDNNFDNSYKSKVDKNTAISGVEILNRYDKLLSNLDVVNMEYTSDGLSIVRYTGDNNTDTFYRDELVYTSGDLTSVKHFYNTSDTVTPSGTTSLVYTTGNLTSTSYTE